MRWLMNALNLREGEARRVFSLAAYLGIPPVHGAEELAVFCGAMAGAGIACLADFMTAGDRKRGDLVQILAKDTVADLVQRGDCAALPWPEQAVAAFEGDAGRRK